MKLTKGTIIIGKKSKNRYEIIEYKETKTVRFKGKDIVKDIYIIKDLNCKYHFEKDSYREMSSTNIEKHYEIEGSKSMNEIFELNKYDEDYGYYTLIDEDDNKVSLMLHKFNGVWLFQRFVGGKIGNTEYISDDNPKLYRKSGRGRESQLSKDKIKELYSLAVEKVLTITDENFNK